MSVSSLRTSTRHTSHCRARNIRFRRIANVSLHGSSTTWQQPGLASAGAISYLPMGGSNYGFFFYLEESPDRDNAISVRHVGGDYFRAMQIPLRRGRVFTDRDDARAAQVAIINESTARHYFGDGDPVGRRVASTTDRVLREIVGVVADVRFDGPAKSGQDELYVPYKQLPWPAMTIVVNSTLDADQ